MNTVALLLLASFTVVLCKPTTTATTVKPETTTVNNSISQYEDLITAIVSLNELTIFNELDNLEKSAEDLGKAFLRRLDYDVHVPTKAIQEFRQVVSRASTSEPQNVFDQIVQIIKERQILEKLNRRTPITRAEATTLIERVFQIQKPEDLPNAVNTLYCASKKLETEFELKLKQLVTKFPGIKAFVQEFKALNNALNANILIVFKPVTDVVQPYLTCVKAPSASE